MADSVGWLKETLGTLTAKGFTEPSGTGYMNGDCAPVLSVACTLNHIRKQSDEVQTLLQPLFDGIRAVAAARDFSVEGLMAAVGNNTVRELMEMVQVDEAVIQKIDNALHCVANKQGV